MFFLWILIPHQFFLVDFLLTKSSFFILTFTVIASTGLVITRTQITGTVLTHCMRRSIENALSLYPSIQVLSMCRIVIIFEFPLHSPRHYFVFIYNLFQIFFISPLAQKCIHVVTKKRIFC